MRYAYLVLILLLIGGSPSIAQAQKSEVSAVYYHQKDTLYRILDGQKQPEVVVRNLPFPSYSHNHQWAAYVDKNGVWMSELSQWEPQIIIRDARGLKWRGFWTSDDTRFIIKFADSVSYTGKAENADTVAYNMITHEVEDWPWGECTRVARKITSGRIALVCFADVWEQHANPAAIALFWGGEYVPYEKEPFQTLVDNFYSWQSPLPYDWGQTSDGDHLVYVADNPDFSWDNNEPPRDIFQIKGIAQPTRINSSENTMFKQILAVSLDRTMVAYEISCDYYGPRDCLIVVNLDTGEIVRNFRNSFFVHFAYDLAWYPDNQRIAFLGDYGSHTDIKSGMHIWVADIQTGKAGDYPIGDYLGGVCCMIVGSAKSQ